MDWPLYIQLSLMMFLQFAVWGAWSPVLAARLLGPLKFSGKQTGWIYGTIFLGCIISPLIAGQIVDRWIATQWFLSAAHLAGGLLLLVAARRKTFWPLFAVMGLYGLAFAPTLALVNSLMFRHLGAARVSPFAVLVWGVIGWVLVGWALAYWRRVKGGSEGADCLILAAGLSLVMSVYCLLLPDTPALGAKQPLTEALSLLEDPNFLVLLAVGFVLATQLQFYFLGTAPYLGELGVQSRNMPAVMTIAQAAQVAAMTFMAFYLKDVLAGIGFRWTFAIGAAMWMVMYGVYSAGKPRLLVVASQALHGLAYAFFINVGFVYVEKIAPSKTSPIASSAQGLYTVVIFGFGLFVGTQITGVTMDRLKTPEGKFRWRAIYLVPCVLAGACAAAIAVMFRG
ncbi:MAG: MFS transporter [Phycisphaerae bacterium]|jgi:nucleoside transporter|nr:MFS transporter [Phycisphaerae bacterium]MDP7289236.1 MFS transporter [Phycisphaerae bacterium]